jgi:pyridoxal phosphate enzyme (YggS family)
VVENIARVRERIAVAARRAGRDPGQVTLMAVSKTVEPERIREAFAAGVRVFGENRVQEFETKISALRELAGATWRLIGHLQSNKAKRAVELFDGLDSVDSVGLARKLDAAAQKALPVLIEVNVGGEAAKSGIAPGSPELEELLKLTWKHLEVRGLMTVPPYTEDPEGARRYFRQLRELGQRLGVKELSMGMSHDFEVAIEEGSTCVRVGTGIFGKRGN